MITLKFAAATLLIGVGCIVLPMQSTRSQKSNGVDPMVVRQRLTHFGYERQSVQTANGGSSEKWFQSPNGPAVLVTFTPGHDSTFTFIDQ